MNHPCLATKFDWMASPWEDSTAAWGSFSSFLESHGVSVFGTEVYKTPSFPPAVPALDPFFPTRDEDFVHRQVRSPGRVKEFRPPRPFCMVAVDDRSRDLYVKAVSKSSNEWRILEYLSSPALRSSPTNHTIPIISMLHHHDEETVFLVQPKWGKLWLYPNLENMKERYIVALQLLEGLAFMHGNGIGHGDLHFDNIVWNYHDMRINRNSPNFTPVRRDFDFRLAFIDFGASVKFPTDDHHVPCASIGPPPPFLSPEQAEGEDGATFDLFAADVYGLGQILIYEASDTLLPPEYNALLSEMTAQEPSHRPSAAEGLKRVQEMMATI